ncbi:hypothetical protein GE21DRAFT_1029463 [Neurospora crassa]|nr:hypothetical protein GE21DRAFT_1029463 [Neurospora crassa]
MLTEDHFVMSDLWPLLRSCHFSNLWAHALSHHAAVVGCRRSAETRPLQSGPLKLRPPPRLLTNHQLMDLDVAVVLGYRHPLIFWSISYYLHRHDSTSPRPQIPKFKPQHQFQMRLRRPSRRPPQRHTLTFEKCWSWVLDTISTMSLLIAS